MTETDIRAFLNDNAEPFDAVNPDAVITKGKRLRRRRRGALSASGIAALVAAVTLPLTLGSPSRGDVATVRPGPDGRPANRPVTSTATPLPAGTTLLRPIALANVTSGDGHVIEAGTRVIVEKDFSGRHPFYEETTVVFRLPKKCISSATLELSTAAGQFPAAAISVYASNLATSAVRATSSPRTFQYDTVLDNQPQAILRPVGDGLSADVTEIAKLWQTGSPFPSASLRVTAGSPLALQIIFSDISEPAFHVSFARPVLRVTSSGSDTCRS